MKRTALALAMSTALVLSAPISALAETSVYQGDAEKSTMELTYTVPQSYRITIPADIKFSSTTLSKSGAITATKVAIPSGKVLKIAFTSANGLTDENDAYKLMNSTSVIPYTIKNNDALVSTTSPLLSLAAGTTEGTINLDFATTADNIAQATMSGVHSDTLTFSVSVDDA